MPGHWELIALAVVLLLLFGSKQLPTIARNLGRGVKEMKDTVGGIDPREDIKRTIDAPRKLEAPDDESSAER